MPVHRHLVAAEGPALLERVAAPAHGSRWGAMHQSQQWRCVLPGAGQVHWRSGDELVFVDALTAFRMRPGDLYQLRHDAGREHDVYCHGEQDAAPGAVRAWRVGPRELLQLRRAITQDMERLKALPLVDTQGISVKLDNLMSLAPTLPLAVPDAVVAKPRETATTDARTAHSQR